LFSPLIDCPAVFRGVVHFRGFKSPKDGVKNEDILAVRCADFMVAGGILLFVISMSDLLTTEKIQRKIDPESLGAVPLGVPLITGPDVLTTSMLLMNEHGLASTAAALMKSLPRSL